MKIEQNKDKDNIIYNVLRIIRGTTVDGPGLRTSIYLAGCPHHCTGCQNPQSWDENNGVHMSLDEILRIVEEEDFNVTLSGGDPLNNPLLAKKLIKALKNNRRNVWVYTGYTWENIIANPVLFDAIRNADILVDGPFIEDLKDLDLPFRGSSNQRLIDIQASIASNSVVLYN